MAAAPEELLADARPAVRRMVDEVVAAHPDTASPVPVEIEVTAGRPAQVVLDSAKGADLLVIGHRGRGAFGNALLGSVGLHCVLHAPCPVTIVRSSG